MKKIIVLTTATALLSSCGIYTKYQPAETTPDNLYGEEVAVDDTTNFGNVNWRELFTDPQLQALIEQGLQNNTDLRSAQLQIEEAEAALMSAKLAFLPSFALSPQGTISSFDKNAATKTYSLPVTASWQVDLFGQLLNSKRNAQVTLKQMKAYRQAVQTQVVSNIANMYYTLMMLDRQLEITKATAEILKKNAETMEAMKDAAMYSINSAGVEQSKAAYAQVLASIPDIEQSIRETENALSTLLGEAPHAIKRGELEAQVLPTELSAGVPIQLLSNRPDVKQAEYTLAQAFYATNEARAAFYPALTISGNYEFRHSLYDIVGSLVQPLFHRGTLKANLDIAKAEQKEADISFRQTIIEAGIEVNDALVAVKSAREKAENYSKQVKHLQDAVKSTQLLMKHGSTTYLEVLTAQQTLLEAQVNQVTNHLTEISNTITLYQALGGGR